MTDKELNSIGQWLNTKGYDLDLTDCFWMEEWIGSETKFRDIAELLKDYKAEQLFITDVGHPLFCDTCKTNVSYWPDLDRHTCNCGRTIKAK